MQIPGPGAETREALIRAGTPGAAVNNHRNSDPALGTGP